MSKNLIEACLVFFCLLLLVAIGPAACYSDQVSIECSLNADKFAPGDLMQGFLSADNEGPWVTVDVYVAFVMSDGTIITLSGPAGPWISNVPLPPGLVGPVMIFELVVPGNVAPGPYLYAAAISPSVSFEFFTMDMMDFEIVPSGPVSGVKMIPIPGGSFRMGSPDDEEGRDDDEGP